MLVMRFSMDAAGVFNYYEDSGPAGMAMCILVHGATLITIGAFGSIQCVVLHTLDCYWKIVHPVHHRKYYRRWMLHVGLLLPWLNGVAINLLPAIGTSRIVNGICSPIAYWPVESMVKVRLSRFRTHFYIIRSFCPSACAVFAVSVTLVYSRRLKISSNFFLGPVARD